GDGCVSGALGEHERAPRRAVGLGALLGVLLGTDRSFGHLAQPVLQGGDGGGHALDEVVDLIAVVAAPLLAELDVAELLGRQLHEPPAPNRVASGDAPFPSDDGEDHLAVESLMDAMLTPDLYGFEDPHKCIRTRTGMAMNWMSRRTTIGERSRPMPPTPMPGIIRRMGPSTGSVMA